MIAKRMSSTPTTWAARAPAAARDRRGRALLGDHLEPLLEHPGLDPADLPARRLRHALCGRGDGVRDAVAGGAAGARPALLPGGRLGRGHERVRRAGPPRNGPNPVTYPFRSWDGKVAIGKQRRGERVTTSTSTAWPTTACIPTGTSTCAGLAGQEIIDDLVRGAEAYLQMWERAAASPPAAARPRSGRRARPRGGAARRRARLAAAPRASRAAAARGPGATAWERGQSWRWR